MTTILCEGEVARRKVQDRHDQSEKRKVLVPTASGRLSTISTIHRLATNAHCLFIKRVNQQCCSMRLFDSIGRLTMLFPICHVHAVQRWNEKQVRWWWRGQIWRKSGDESSVTRTHTYSIWSRTQKQFLSQDHFPFFTFCYLAYIAVSYSS